MVKGKLQAFSVIVFVVMFSMFGNAFAPSHPIGFTPPPTSDSIRLECPQGQILDFSTIEPTCREAVGFEVLTFSAFPESGLTIFSLIIIIVSVVIISMVIGLIIRRIRNG